MPAPRGASAQRAAACSPRTAPVSGSPGRGRGSRLRPARRAARWRAAHRAGELRRAALDQQCGMKQGRLAAHQQHQLFERRCVGGNFPGAERKEMSPGLCRRERSCVSLAVRVVAVEMHDGRLSRRWRPGGLSRRMRSEVRCEIPGKFVMLLCDCFRWRRGHKQRGKSRIEQIDAGKVMQNALVNAQWRGGEAARPVSASIRRSRRSGAAGASALQCGSASAASASPKVGAMRCELPWTSAHCAASAESISTPAQSSSMSRSNEVRPKIAVSRSIAAGGSISITPWIAPGSFAWSASLARSRANSAARNAWLASGQLNCGSVFGAAFRPLRVAAAALMAAP